MDLQQAFDAGFDAVKKYVDDIVDQVEARLIALESRPQPKIGERGLTGERGADGKDGAAGKDGVGLADIIRDADGNLVAVLSDGRTKAIGNIAVRDGVDGKNGDAGRDGVDGAPGKDGVDGKDGANGRDGLDGKDGLDGAPGRDGVDGKDGAPGRDGVDGKSVDMDEVRATLAEMVAEAIAAVPIPKDGKDGRDGVDGKNGIDGLNGKDGINGVDGRDGADGIGLAAAMQDAEGNLIVTDTKGGVHNIGRVRGANGANGRDGEAGAPGKDGVDGIGFDDMDLVETETGLSLRFSRGEVVKKFSLPTPYYRGTYKDDATYVKGSAVTFGGHYWIAVEDNPTDKPDTGKGWRMAVRKARDGKDGVPGERGPEGKPGPAGRDLTQMGPDGGKW